MDFVNSRKPFWNLGPRDTPQCRSAWQYIEHLSMRAVRLSVVATGFAKCLSNVLTLSAGFNTLLITDPLNDFTFANLDRMRSIDVSYGYVDDTSHKSNIWNNWTRHTDDYFPPIVDRTNCSKRNVSYPIVSTKELVRLFLGISQSFVPQIVFTKPEIYILFRIFWTLRKSRLSQTSDVDNCSR